MNNFRVSLTKVSQNSKTGPIAVSSTSAASCPDSCPLKKNGCYAGMSYAGIHWRKLDDPQYGLSWVEYCASVKALPKRQILRHNVAGDLPHNSGFICAESLSMLVSALKGKQGFTYTHHDPYKGDNAGLIRTANSDGFAVNLSSNNLEHADELKRLDAGPVVVLMPEDAEKTTITPAGNFIALCPATYMQDMDCSRCMICANATRKVIIGFPAHGAAKKKVQKVISIYSSKG